MTNPSPMGATRYVVCLGESLIDLIGESVSSSGHTARFVPRVGGAPANVAVGLVRLGVPAYFVGALASEDPFASMILTQLGTHGVDTSRVVRVPEAQTRLAVVTGEADQRTFYFYGHPAADTLLTPEGLDLALIQGAAALYVGALPLAAEPTAGAVRTAVQWAVGAGVPVCFDPNPRPSMWPSRDTLLRACRPVLTVAQVIKLSVADLAVLGLSVEDVATLAPQARVRVITDGHRGCRYWLGEQEGLQPAFAVEQVDATGAGDAFTAGLIARGLKREFRYAPEDIAFAAAAGALATEKVGAHEALPTQDEVYALITGMRGG